MGRQIAELEVAPQQKDELPKTKNEFWWQGEKKHRRTSVRPWTAKRVVAGHDSDHMRARMTQWERRWRSNLLQSKVASPECFAVAKQLPAKRCPIKPSRLQTKVQTTLKPMAYTLVTSTSHHPAAHNIIGAYSGVTNQTTLGKILFEAKKCPDALHRNIRLLTGVNLCVYTNACMSTNVYIRMYIYICMHIRYMSCAIYMDINSNHPTVRFWIPGAVGDSDFQVPAINAGLRHEQALSGAHDRFWCLHSSVFFEDFGSQTWWNSFSLWRPGWSLEILESRRWSTLFFHHASSVWCTDHMLFPNNTCVTWAKELCLMPFTIEYSRKVCPIVAQTWLQWLHQCFTILAAPCCITLPKFWFYPLFATESFAANQRKLNEQRVRLQKDDVWPWPAGTQAETILPRAGYCLAPKKNALKHTKVVVPGSG